MSQHVLTHPNWIKMESPILKTVRSQEGAYCPPGSGKGPCLNMGQKPASLAPISHAPTLAMLGGTYFQVPVLRGILGGHSTILTSLCSATVCLNYQQAQCGNQSGVKSFGTVYKAHLILGQGSPCQHYNPHLYENSPCDPPRRKNNALAKTPISHLMTPEQHLSLP